LDDFGCEREKGHERGLREIHQLDPVWTLGSFWTLECKAKSFVEHLFANYLYVHASYSSPNWFCTCNLWLPSDQAPGSAISNMPVPEFKSDLRLNFNE